MKPGAIKELRLLNDFAQGYMEARRELNDAIPMDIKDVDWRSDDKSWRKDLNGQIEHLGAHRIAGVGGKWRPEDFAFYEALIKDMAEKLDLSIAQQRAFHAVSAMQNDTIIELMGTYEEHLRGEINYWVVIRYRLGLLAEDLWEICRLILNPWAEVRLPTNSGDI